MRSVEGISAVHGGEEVNEETSIDIYAILDCRRHPSWIRERLVLVSPPE